MSYLNSGVSDARKDMQLKIAKEIIEILARQPNLAASSMTGDEARDAMTRIVEAARVTYTLPSYCSERCEDVSQCLACIVNMVPITDCLKPIERSPVEEQDIVWEV